MDELTKKVFQPMSNADLERTVKTMGEMFETAAKYSGHPTIKHTTQNTEFDGKQFANRLTALLKERNYTQKYVAQCVGAKE